MLEVEVSTLFVSNGDILLASCKVSYRTAVLGGDSLRGKLVSMEITNRRLLE